MTKCDAVTRGGSCEPPLFASLLSDPLVQASAAGAWRAGRRCLASEPEGARETRRAACGEGGVR